MNKSKSNQVAENKTDYLRDINVRNFVGHIKELLGGEPFKHEYTYKVSKDVAGKWKCVSLADSLRQYCWNEIDFKRNNEILEDLSKRLKEAINANKQKDTLSVCVKILEWGGVTNGAHGLVRLYLDDQLTKSISNAAKFLTSDEVDLACFSKTKINDEENCSGLDYDVNPTNDNNSGPTRIRMNASFTKIYSLYSDKPFVIYDSRVAAALGLIAKKYWKGLDGSCNIPELLRFSWLKGRGGNRNASDDQVKLSEITTERNHALWNIRANWIIEEALKDIKEFAGMADMPKKVRGVEAALFMIGYSVSPER